MAPEGARQADLGDGFAQLPSEVRLAVATYLPDRDLLALASVDRQTHADLQARLACARLMANAARIRTLEDVQAVLRDIADLPSQSSQACVLEKVEAQQSMLAPRERPCAWKALLDGASALRPALSAPLLEQLARRMPAHPAASLSGAFERIFAALHMLPVEYRGTVLFYLMRQVPRLPAEQLAGALERGFDALAPLPLEARTGTLCVMPAVTYRLSEELATATFDRVFQCAQPLSPRAGAKVMSALALQLSHLPSSDRLDAYQRLRAACANLPYREKSSFLTSLTQQTYTLPQAARSEAVEGLMAATRTLPGRHRFAPLAELPHRLYMIADPARRHAFTAMLEIGAELPLRRRAEALVILATQLVQLAPALRESSFDLLSEATRRLPAQHRLPALSALMSQWVHLLDDKAGRFSALVGMTGTLEARDAEAALRQVIWLVKSLSVHERAAAFTQVLDRVAQLPEPHRLAPLDECALLVYLLPPELQRSFFERILAQLEQLRSTHLERASSLQTLRSRLGGLPAEDRTPCLARLDRMRVDF